MNLDQQIADTAAQIRAFMGVSGEQTKIERTWAQGLAKHLVNTRLDVNAQLLEATREAAAHGLAHLYLCKARERSRFSALGVKTMEDVFGHNHFDCSCQMQEHDEALKAAIANADKVAS